MARALTGVVLFAANAAMCAVNVGFFADGGNPYNAAVAALCGLVAIHISIIWRD